MGPWPSRTLGDICDEVGGIIQTGPFGSQLHESDYSSEGTPVVMPKDIIEGKVSTDGIARIEAHHVERLARHRLKIGDIVYGRRGDIGRQALITPPQEGWLCGTGCLRLSLGQEVIEPLFLHYYLRQESVIRWISNQAVGATLPNLNTEILRSVPVLVPPLNVQHRIASILSAYDDLIENNLRRIKILEEMARALYREWFVEYRFPGHAKVPRVGSAVGPIPKGWDVRKLGEILQLNYGKALKSGNRIKGSVPVFGSSGIVDYHHVSLVLGPGIIVGRKGNVGSLYWSPDDFYPIDTVYFVTSSLPLRFLFHDLQTKNFINNDAAVPGLNRNQAYSLKTVIPPPDILDRFCRFADEFDKQASILRKKCENLKSTRDILLPRLLSGKIDVAEPALTA